MKTGSDKLGAISRLTGMAGICGDTVVEYESGKRLCFSALDTLRVEEADGSVSAAAEIPGYSVRLTVQRLEADVFSLRELSVYKHV